MKSTLLVFRTKINFKNLSETVALNQQLGHRDADGIFLDFLTVQYIDLGPKCFY
jgi:hypothetical protein